MTNFIPLLSVDQNPTMIFAALFAIVLIAYLTRGILSMKRQLRERTQELNSVFKHKNQGVYSCDMNGKVLTANIALARLFNFASAEQFIEAVNSSKQRWHYNKSRSKRFLDQLMKNGKCADFDWAYNCPNSNKTIWLRETAWQIYDKSGKPTQFEGTILDITQQVRQEHQQNQLNILAKHLPGGLFQLRISKERKTQLQYASSGLADLLKMDFCKLMQSSYKLADHIHIDDQINFHKGLKSLRKNNNQLNLDFRLVHHDGTFDWVNIMTTRERQKDGSVIWHGYICQINERKKIELKIQELAYRDALTNLPNRRQFTDRLYQAVDSASRHNKLGGVVYMDLDDFKALNDNFGHDIGDELLVSVAKKLKANTRINDIVTRFGGDEFVILLEDLGNNFEEASRSAAQFGNKILSQFRKGFELSNGPHFATASIGIALFDGNKEKSPGMLTREADEAMYLAKQAGRNTFRIFSEDNLTSDASAVELERDLEAAIANNELCLHHQPQIGSDGKIIGSEALVRWNHPTYGLLLPGRFMPIAERTGLIKAVNDWVIKEACKALHSWEQDELTMHMGLSINISEQSMSSPTIVSHMKEQFAIYPFDRNKLTIELTEKALTRRTDAIAKQMSAMKLLGIRFSLDDFGTGHSSLSLLNQFPLDEVKIDGSFVSEIESTQANRTLIEGILGMASALHLETVAEHVGSPFQEEFLRSRGCSKFQGYLYHAPMRESKLVELLANSQTSTHPLDRKLKLLRA